MLERSGVAGDEMGVRKAASEAAISDPVSARFFGSIIGPEFWPGSTPDALAATLSVESAAGSASSISRITAAFGLSRAASMAASTRAGSTPAKCARFFTWPMLSGASAARSSVAAQLNCAPGCASCSGSSSGSGCGCGCAAGVLAACSTFSLARRYTSGVICPSSSSLRSGSSLDSALAGCICSLVRNSLSGVRKLAEPVEFVSGGLDSRSTPLATMVCYLLAGIGSASRSIPSVS